jgi:UDP-N-acetylglucosamine--N-acetylmuramyl-(pentapeptide) pyrophosphoryl-undecaprenol N-acetylglucosamine transferase
VVYVGSTDGMESGLVARESNLPFRGIASAALRGRAPWTLARNIALIARGTQQARRLIAEQRPGAILGTGGYVCVPLFLAARRAGVPTIIYLPDVVPGLAVRLLARLATVVACNVEDSATYFRLQIADCRLQSQQSPISNVQSAIYIVGYPVRRELFEQDKAACRAAFGLHDGLPVLFVYGGSRGARSINKAIAALLPHLLPLAQIIHVCGREGDETFLREAAARLPAELQQRYKLYPYLFSSDNDKMTRWQGDKIRDKDVILSSGHLVTPSMARAFGAADLAVCRSGASTMAELPAAKLPAVLVPYPYVHQDENADYLVQRGAAVKVADAEMSGSGQPEDGPLFHAIQRLLKHDDERQTMSERSAALARPDAVHCLTDLLLSIAQSTEARP